MSEQKSGSAKWVVIPAIITLAITLVRLVGELQGWSTEWFGVEPGGGNAPGTIDKPAMPSWFGIFWLMPIMGCYFAFRLLRSGGGPDSKGKALLMPFIALVLMVGTTFAFISQYEDGVKTNVFFYSMVTSSVVGWVAVILAFKGWRALVGLTLLYGILARLPVIVITLIIVPMEKGTHYEKLAPFAPDQDLTMTAFWLCLAQVGMWIPLTAVSGALFGGLTALVVPRKKG